MFVFRGSQYFIIFKTGAMQIRSLQFYFVFLALSILFSCKPKLDAPDPSPGSIDVTNYVAVGNSITSGYTDGALFYEGQLVSYPNLLAEQFMLIGGRDFRQPLVQMSSVGIGAAGNGRFNLDYVTDCKGLVSLSPKSQPGDFNAFEGVAHDGPFNNMGVPGAKAIHLVYPGYGNPLNGFGKYNPFFARMLDVTEYGNASILAKATEQKPTFFSLFIGNNDVLGYALSGGSADSITPLQGPPGYGFEASIDVIVNALTASGAKGVIANIPDITNLPYFTTIPFNSLVLDANQAAQLNGIQSYINIGLTFSAGAQPYIVKDQSLPAFANVRRMKSNELVLLSAPGDSIKCFGAGSASPLNERYVLLEAEIKKIQQAIYNYNLKLQAVAKAKGLAYVDVNAFMQKCKKGIVYNGIGVNATFVSGGAFSLDGVHLTPLGNALLANEFIKAINSNYGSSIPEIDAGKYGGVRFR